MGLSLRDVGKVLFPLEVYVRSVSEAGKTLEGTSHLDAPSQTNLAFSEKFVYLRQIVCPNGKWRYSVAGFM